MRPPAHRPAGWEALVRLGYYELTREKVTVLTAVPAELLARAEKAAYLKDVQAHVLTARQARQRAVSLWDESRVWDPGD